VGEEPRFEQRDGSVQRDSSSVVESRVGGRGLQGCAGRVCCLVRRELGQMLERKELSKRNSHASGVCFEPGFTGND
jgi:hypothetical protein